MSLRRLVASLLALVSVATSQPALAAAPAKAAATEQELPSFADVRVDPGVDDPEYARSWCAIGINRGIAKQPLEAQKLGARRLAVELSGSVGAYHLDVGLKEAGEWSGEVGRRDCRCSDAELMTAIAELVADAASRVNAEQSLESAASSAVTAPRVAPETKPVDRTKRAPLGRLGSAGVGLTVGGAGVAAMGVGFLAKGRDYSAATSDEREVGTDFTTPGIIALAAGVAVLAAGIGLVAVDRNRAKRSRASARGSWTPTFAGTSLIGRF
jgi:hypothetical protein